MIIDIDLYQNELRVKRMYIRYISHEVRTPFNAVYMGLQYLQAEASALLRSANSELLETLEASISSTLQAIGILDEMLLIDRIEEGTLPLVIDTHSAKEIIEDSLSAVTPQVIYLLQQASYRFIHAGFF